MKTIPIQKRPIQVKALTPKLDPQIWKAATLSDCLDLMRTRHQKFATSRNEWILEFREGTIAGIFLTIN